MFNEMTPYGMTDKITKTGYSDPLTSSELDKDGVPYVETSLIITCYILKDEARRTKDKALENKAAILGRDLDAEAAVLQAIVDKLEPVIE